MEEWAKLKCVALYACAFHLFHKGSTVDVSGGRIMVPGTFQAVV